MTQEAGNLCSRILQRLASSPNPQPGAFLFTGNRGVGKTHLLHYLAALVRDPNAAAWAELNPFIQDSSRPKAPLNSLFIQVPEDPEINVDRFLSEKLKDVIPSARAGSSMPDGFASRLRDATIQLSADGLGFIVLEDVSQRIDRITDPKQLQRDIWLYRALAEAFAQHGILAIFVAEERHLKPNNATPVADCPLSGLSSCCDFIWLSRNNIAEIIARALATKNEGQKSRIREILDQLRRKLPTFGPNAETFVELYPIHPHLFNALFQLRTLMPQFSPLSFVQTAIESALDQPAERLVCLDCLFDYIVPELRQRYRPLLTCYDEFRAKVIPQLKAQVRQKAEVLLKGIAFSTICETLPSSVQSLANSLLLYDESDFLPSYSMTFALLMEMEQKGGSYLLAEGENLDRHYRLLHDVKPVNLKASREFLEQEHEFRLRLPLLIYDWVRKNIPDWTPESSPKYRRSSQTIAAPLPGSGTKASGLVHFKSVLDPLWSEEDLSLVLEGPHSWIVLLLNPTEHFYELEPSIRTLAAHSPKIMIWRPDTPNAAELERLRGYALQTQNPEPSSTAAKRSASCKSNKEEARKILTDLYVKRGKLITATDKWSIGDEIEGFSLAQYLSHRLGKIASLESRDGNAQSAPVSAKNEIEPLEAIRWASALAGQNFLPDTDPAEAAGWLLNWWASIHKMDPSLPSGGLEALPESFRTVRLWNEIKSLQGHLDLLRPAMHALRRQEISFTELMTQVFEHFKDQSRMLAWKQSLEKIVAAIQWAPEFEQARSYVSLAFPTGQARLDELRNALLEMIDHPHRLMDAAERDNFERMLEEFKNGYIDLYHSRHEDTVHITADSSKSEPKVNSTALHNLEMLSNLHYTDKSHLNRVRIVGKWLHGSQCGLPVREILDKYPRCHCNFNPGGNAQRSALVEQINTAILEGIEYFRNILRKCSRTIIEELKNLKVDDNHAKQIAALLSRGPMIPLKPRAIDILNEVIQRHATEFISEMRSCDTARPGP